MTAINKKAILEVMQEALKRETEAFNYYHKASVKTPFQETKALLLQLAEEERKHRVFINAEIERIDNLLNKEKEENYIDAEHVSYAFPDDIIFKRIQSCPGVDLAAVSLPSELLGGDYLDTIRLPQENRSIKLGIFLYDVMGHGMNATNLKALAKKEWGILREEWMQKKSDVDMNQCREVITYLNQKLVEYCISKGSFLSAIYGIIDPEEGILTYTSAGHDPPIMINEEGQYNHLNTTELLLGVDSDLTYSETSITLKKGEVLALYSDGLTEVENHRSEMFERCRLRRAIEQYHAESAENIVLHVMNEIRRFIHKRPVTDELTFGLAKIES